MAAINITEEAAKQISKLVNSKPEAIGVRLGTSKYGCSGLGYEVDYVTVPIAGDEMVEDKGVKVFVDRKSLLFLLGTVMDWEDTKFTTGFKFSNPNEKGRCGCGESFMV